MHLDTVFIIFSFFVHKKYSRSFVKLRWCHMDYFTDVLATFLDLGTLQFCCCLWRNYPFNRCISPLVSFPHQNNRSGVQGTMWQFFYHIFVLCYLIQLFMCWANYCKIWMWIQVWICIIHFLIFFNRFLYRMQKGGYNCGWKCLPTIQNIWIDNFPWNRL